MTRLPRVEIVIGVHNDRRPIERAVASALRTQASVLVTVVSHNHPAELVRDRLAPLADERVRILELHDRVRSPGSAYNYGLNVAVGEFVGVLGSDDELATDALDQWLALADRVKADVVVAPVWRVGGGAVPAPRVRVGRTTNLDGERDRLFERTAPLGIWRRERFGELRFLEGVPRGVDQLFGLHLWFSGASIAFDPHSAPYVEHNDQRDRVTMQAGPLLDDFGYLEALKDDATLHGMGAPGRRAIIAKILRSHVLGAVSSRIATDSLGEDERDSLARVVQTLLEVEPGALGILARRDVHSLRLALDPSVGIVELRAAVARRASYRSLDAVLAQDWWLSLSRQAPLRSLTAGYLVARTVRRSYNGMGALPAADLG